MEKFLNNQQIPLVRVIDPSTGQEYYAPEATVYDDRNGPNPTTLRSVVVDQANTASYFDGRVVSASYALTASYVSGSSSAAISASYAVSASYAANGGVTQLLAGPNITLSPTNGLGQVTVSATLSGSTIFNTATGSYGSFYDTTTQTNPIANVARSMSFNSTDITNGVSISGSTSPFNTYIKTQNAGVYDIQFSAQLDKTDSGTDEVVIWLRKNGIDLTDSATTLTLSGNNDKQVAAWNWFVTSATGDYYQIIWRSLDTSLRLLAEPISGTHPGIPSVILTVNRVDQFLSNTGSFSGSFTGEFTGSLLGTSSYAVQAGNSNTIDVNSFGSPVESYLLMSNVVATTGVAIGGDTDLRYNSSTNVLTVPNISATTLTASNATISGNVTVLGTASINSLVVNQIGYSSGSNQLGDAANDTQTLYGSVIIPTGSLTVTGSTRITGSLNVTGQAVVTNGAYIYNNLTIETSNLPVLNLYDSLQTHTWQFRSNGTSLSFLDNGTTRMWIGGIGSGNGGKVGINTINTSAQLTVKGSGTTSGTTALLVQNANTSASLQVYDDNTTVVTGTDNPSVFTVGWGKSNTLKLGSNTANSPQISLGSLTLTAHPGGSSLSIDPGFINTTNQGTNTNRPITLAPAVTGNSTGNIILLSSGARVSAYRHNPTSGVLNMVMVGGATANQYMDFSPSSGNAEFNQLNIVNQINTSGSYSGIVRGIYYNPILTSITGVTHRAIETTTGNVIFGSTSGNVGIGITNPNYKLDVSGSSEFVGNMFLTGSLSITGSAGTGSALYAYKSGSTVLDIQGSQGQLFSVTDALSGSLMSVNDVSGLPILEVFSDDRVVMGTYGAPGLTVSGSTISATGSLLGTASLALTSSYVLNAVSASFARTASYVNPLVQNVSLNGSLTVTGSTANRSTRITDTGFYLSRTSDGGYASSIIADGNMTYGTRNNHIFQNDGSTTMTLVDNTRNVLIGTSTDAGYKLDVNGTGRVQGQLNLGNASTDGFLYSSPSVAMRLGGGQTFDVFQFSQINNGIFFTGGSTELSFFRLTIGQNTSAGGSSLGNVIRCLGNITNSALTNVYNVLTVNTTVNTTGGTTTFRGFYHNPTLTSLTGVTHRAIETVTGNVIFGSTSGNVGIRTTTPSASLHISGASSAILLEIDSPTLNNILYVSGSGNIGMGTGTPNARLQISGSNPLLRLNGSGSELMSVDGVSGRLFTVSDDLTNSLFSVNTIAGLPVIEAFATNDVFLGKYGVYPIKTVTSGTLAVITGSLLGTASFATSASWAPSPLNGGSSGYLPLWDSTSTLTTSSFYQDTYGQIGYRTTSPQWALDLLYHTLGWGTSANLGINSGEFWQTATYGFQWIIRDPIAGTIYPMRITKEGVGINIGVASTPTAKLQIKGDGSTSSTTPFFIENANSDPLLIVKDDSNIGIGTTSPSYTLDVSGSINTNTSLTVTGSLLISGSATIGSSSPSTENTLTLGPPPGGGTGEGGQLGLQSTGGSYTSASFIDTWQNQFRILRGSNAGSNAGLMYMDLQTGNTQFVGAVTASAYSGLPNDYLYATRATSNQTVGSAWANTDIIFNNVVVSKGISFNTSTGVASLTGGKVYRVTARLAWSAAATYNLQFSCYTSANTQIGPTVEIIQSPNGTNNISDGTLEFIYAPGSNTDIKIRCTNNNTALSGEQIRYDLNTQFIIQQIA